MNALDAQDYLTLHLAIDLLGRHTDNDLSKARKQSNSAAKQLALITLRQRIANVRAKLQAMEAQS